MKKYMIPILFLAVLVLSLGCVAQDGSVQENQVEDNTSPALPSNQTNMTGQVKEFILRASNYEFDPEIMVASRGDLIRITLIDTSGTHNLFIDGYNVRSNTLNRGEEQVIEFVADKEGSFDFWCEVGDHRSRGMEGELLIRPPKK